MEAQGRIQWNSGSEMPIKMHVWDFFSPLIGSYVKLGHEYDLFFGFFHFDEKYPLPRPKNEILPI